MGYVFDMGSGLRAKGIFVADGAMLDDGDRPFIQSFILMALIFFSLMEKGFRKQASRPTLLI